MKNAMTVSVRNKGICLAAAARVAVTATKTAHERRGGMSNQPSTISVNPPHSVCVGESYSFTPSAGDPDDDTLTFSVQNVPSCASFDKAWVPSVVNLFS